MPATFATTGRTVPLLKRLLAPHDKPYTEAVVLERALDLAELHARAAADPALQIDLLDLSRSSFWAHLALFVWTHDEKAAQIRYKPFSPLRMYQTTANFCDEVNPDGTWAHPIISIQKSRQLMLSWFVMARLDWCCLHRAHSYTFVLSEEETKAVDQVKRIETIHGYYPPWFTKAAGLTGARCLRKGVVYPNLSQIRSATQKAGRAAASYVPTMGLSDEAAHQPYFEKNWTSIKGTVGAHTQMFVVSSVAPSYFQKIMEDTQDGTRGGREHTYFQHKDLSAWRNKVNRVDCMDIGFLADPARRSKEWEMQARRGMSNYQWRQEQLRDYSARGGRPIFTMLDRAVHVTDGHLSIVRHGNGWGLRIEGYNDPWGQPIIKPVRLLRATDHGVSNFCATVWIAVDDDLDWFVHRVRKQRGWVAPANAAAIHRASGEENYVRDTIDAMNRLNDKQGKVEDLYREYQAEDGSFPFRRLEACEKGPNSRAEGLDAITAMMLSTLATCAPDHDFWKAEGYEPWQLPAFKERSSIYFGRDVAEPLLEELDKARWDERPGGDPEMNQPETSSDMMDDAIDALRYAIRSAGRQLLRQVQRVSP